MRCTPCHLPMSNVVESGIVSGSVCLSCGAAVTYLRGHEYAPSPVIGEPLPPSTPKKLHPMHLPEDDPVRLAWIAKATANRKGAGPSTRAKVNPSFLPKDSEGYQEWRAKMVAGIHRSREASA